MVYDFVVGIVAIVAAWVSSKRWFDGYKARYGSRPPNDWMLKRVDDRGLERERRILIVVLIVATIIAIRVLSRSAAI